MKKTWVSGKQQGAAGGTEGGRSPTGVPPAAAAEFRNSRNSRNRNPPVLRTRHFRLRNTGTSLGAAPLWLGIRLAWI